MSRSPKVFDERVDRYDARYDSPGGRALLFAEVDCIRPLLVQFPGHCLEIGVGTGRFAEALGVCRDRSGRQGPLRAAVTCRSSRRTDPWAPASSPVRRMR